MPGQVSFANGIVNPYGSGDVRLDSSPVAAYFLRQENQKRATDEALDKYFIDMQRSITPTGMRNQEVGKLVEMQKADQDFYLQNKAAIKNPALDNGKARSEFMGRHADKLALIQQSKNELAGTDALIKLRSNPNLADRIDENTLKALDVVNLPIGHPNRDRNANDVLSEVTFEAKRLTPAEQIARQKWYGTAAGKLDTERVVVGVDPTDNLKDIVRYVAKYKPEDLQKIGAVAAMDYSDPSVKRSFEHPNAEQLIQLTEVGKQAYGPDWIPDTPEKVYQAAAIAHSLSESVSQKSEVNKQRADAAAFARQKAMAATRAATTKEEQQPIDLYNGLERRLFKPQAGENMFTINGKEVGVPINLLSEEQQNYVVGQAKNNVKDPSLIGYDNVLLIKKGNRMAIARYRPNDEKYTKRLNSAKDIPDEEIIVYLSPRGTNVQGNQPLGQKAKQEAAKRAGTQPKSTPKEDPLGIL